MTNVIVNKNTLKKLYDFKKYVLDHAVKEINKVADLKVSYEQEKKGRNIIGFKFKVLQDNKPKKTGDSQRDPNTADMFTIDGLTDKQLARIAKSEQFKADYNHLISPTSPINNDYTGQAWVNHFVKELKKDASQFNKRPIKEYLDY